MISIIANAAVLGGMAFIGLSAIKDHKNQSFLDTISAKEKYCLQQNVYFEARNQSKLGQEAVAWVTLNRVDHKNYPNTICDVVWQRKQFSWTHDGKSDKPGTNVLEQKAWEKAGKIANDVLVRWNNGDDSPVDDAFMYHADWVSPYWKDSYDFVTKIDEHIFYN